MAAVPIWKDLIVNLSTAASVQFRVILSDTGDVVYTGKSFKRPGETYAQARINDICADYLVNVLPNLAQAEFTQLTLPVTFVTQILSGGSWTTRATTQFINDWSYDYNYNPVTMGMSFPINGHIDHRMPIVWTGLNVSQVTAIIYFTDGTSSQVIIPVEITPDFSDDYNDDFARSVRSAGSGTAVFLPSAWDNVDRITIGRSTFKVVTDCARYALYYVNVHGGWDSFLIEGNSLEADTLKRYTREMDYDNRNISNRGRQNYVNEITKGYTFHTGWLRDEQAERMHNLLNSPNVYMYDLSTRQMIPVTIPTNTCEYKTYKNQGNKLVNYTIQVEIAQDRIRR